MEHFDEEWRPLPDYNPDQPRHPFRPFGITPGHGLEWSRLLLQVRASLRSPPDWLLDAARGLFARATAEGWQANGGFVYTTDHEGRPVVSDRLHWVVTEAIGAAAALHAVTGDVEYEHWYRTLWDFAELHLIDREQRELARRAGRGAPAEPADLGGQAGRLPLAPGHAHSPPAGPPEPGRRAPGQPARVT